jgi:formylglycine-generating enzyme required for sulfatase activity
LDDTGYLPLPDSWTFGVMAICQRNHPVHGIAPEAAEAYAEWLSRRTGRCFRLPTEAEWEVAAGNGSRDYPWGDRFARDRANTVESGLLTTTPVGIFPAGASPFGCMDMAGNVEEFVACPYTPYPGGRESSDDLVRSNPHYRVARGGSFTRYRDLTRCTRRHGNYDSPLYVIGFRLAETVEV